MKKKGDEYNIQKFDEKYDKTIPKLIIYYSKCKILSTKTLQIGETSFVVAKTHTK